ncbi:MAG: hypothetical protein ACP5J4_11095 [Anaerolineae bacterium]
MAEITAVKTAIGTLLSGVSGIERVYTTAPNSLPPADLPAAVIYTGSGVYAERGYNQRGETRQYIIRVYVLSLQQGVPGEAENRCEPFLVSVRAAFPDGHRLNRLAGVLEARLTGDQGISVLVLGGVSYLGVEFALEVTQ